MKKIILLLLFVSGFVGAMGVAQKLSFKNVQREAAWELEKNIIGLNNYIKGYPQIMFQIKELKKLSKQGSEVYQTESKPHVKVIEQALQKYYKNSQSDW